MSGVTDEQQAQAAQLVLREAEKLLRDARVKATTKQRTLGIVERLASGRALPDELAAELDQLRREKQRQRSKLREVGQSVA